MKDRVKPRLSRVDGVGQVTIVGGEEREIRVNIDQQKMHAYGLSVMQITGVIKSSNLDFPTGNIKEGSDHMSYASPENFRIRRCFARTCRCPHAAGRRCENRGYRRSAGRSQKIYETISRLKCKTAIGVLVQKQTDANTVDVSRLVRAEIPKIEKDYAANGVKFDVAEDDSAFTLDSANGVKFDLMMAVILVALVMLAFLHSIRNSVIVMIAIPASMLSTFIAMYVFDFSLNMMTLLGLSLIVGILVDDSIVVLENIHRHLEMGQDKRIASIRGRNEIGFAALSITMVDVVVFVPLALVNGLIGNIMREFALVVVFSTLMSLFVSFTITPMLASRFAQLEHFSKRKFLGRFALWFEKWFNALTDEYTLLLKWGLYNRWKVCHRGIRPVRRFDCSCAARIHRLRIHSRHRPR